MLLFIEGSITFRWLLKVHLCFHSRSVFVKSGLDAKNLLYEVYPKQGSLLKTCTFQILWAFKMQKNSKAENYDLKYGVESNLSKPDNLDHPKALIWAIYLIKISCIYFLFVSAYYSQSIISVDKQTLLISKHYTYSIILKWFWYHKRENVNGEHFIKGERKKGEISRLLWERRVYQKLYQILTKT